MYLFITLIDSTLDTKVKALNEIISSMNATLYKLKYKNKLLKVETRMNNTLLTKKFDTLVSELLLNTTKTTNIIASINDEVNFFIIHYYVFI